MTLDEIVALRNALIGDATLTSMVSEENIRVGWVSIVNSFPSIIITQVGGIAKGMLGYSASTTGNKLRRNEGTIQFDILSTTSRAETLQIADRIEKIFLDGISDFQSFTKTSDMDMYDEEAKVYRKIQVWKYIRLMYD